jgi:uncharacterized protein (TIRG00374 family)
MNLTVSRGVKIGALGAVMSTLAFVFIISQIRPDQFASAFARANYAYVLPCLLFLLLGLVTRALRWRALLGGALPLSRSFSIMNVAYLVNGVLPLRLGEVVRIYLTSQIKDHPVGVLKTTGSILVERLLDLLAIVLMVLLGLLFAPVPPELQSASAVAALSAMTGFITLVVLAGHRAWVHRLLGTITGRFHRLDHQRLARWVNEFLDGLAPLRSLRGFLTPVLWTCASWVLSLIAGYWLMFAIFGESSFVTTALYIAAAAFAIAVPAVPGNLGTYEWSIILALSAMGYTDMDRMTAFAVLVHAVNVLVHASTGLIGLVKEGISLQQLQRGVRQMQQLEG